MTGIGGRSNTRSARIFIYKEKKEGEYTLFYWKKVFLSVIFWVKLYILVAVPLENFGGKNMRSYEEEEEWEEEEEEEEEEW